MIVPFIDPGDLSDSFIMDYVNAMAPIILSLARIRPAGDDAGDDVRINYRGGWFQLKEEWRRIQEAATGEPAEPVSVREDEIDYREFVDQGDIVRVEMRDGTDNGLQWWISVNKKPWTPLRSVALGDLDEPLLLRRDALLWLETERGAKESDEHEHAHDEQP